MKYKIIAEYNAIGKREYNTNNWQPMFEKLKHSRFVMFAEVIDLETNEVIKTYDDRLYWQWNEDKKRFERKKGDYTILNLLTDPTFVSINNIQQAHKQADNGFNDAIAQLYDIEFRKQEILKQDRIKEAKEKAIEEQKAEAERVAKEIAETRRNEQANGERAKQGALQKTESDSSKSAQDTSNDDVQASETTVQSTSSAVGSDWSQVSPEQASAYMSARTGVSASTWQAIIYAESTNNPTVTNSIGCFGYLQLHPVHGSVSAMTPQQYLETAVGVFNSQGLSAWEVTTNGMVK